MLHLILSAVLANSPFVVPPPATTVQSSAGVETCGPGDTTCFDKNGVIGAPASGTTDPTGVMLRGKQCSASDTSCTPANVVIAGGMSIIDIGIDAGDPDANCPGNNDTVTLSIAGENGTLALSAVVLTEGAHWNAVASDVPATATSLAAAITTACIVSGVTYYTAVATSTEAQITLTPAASTMTQLIESTAACTTVATLSRGQILSSVGTATAPAYSFINDTNTGVYSAGSDNLSFAAGGITPLSVTTTVVAIGQVQLSVAQALYSQNPTSNATCADDAAGTSPTCTLSSAEIRLTQHVTCNDSNGCNLLLDETSALSTAILIVCNIGTNAVVFPTTAGQQETQNPVLMDDGCVMFSYNVDRWVQLTPPQNPLTKSEICFTSGALDMNTLTDQTIFTVPLNRTWHWTSLMAFDCSAAVTTATWNAGCTAGMVDSGLGTMSAATFNLSATTSKTFFEGASSTEGAAGSACGINVLAGEGAADTCYIRVCGSLD